MYNICVGNKIDYYSPFDGMLHAFVIGRVENGIGYGRAPDDNLWTEHMEPTSPRPVYDLQNANKVVGYAVDLSPLEQYDLPTAPCLKLFVWHDSLYDYTPGVIFALAHNVDEARKKVLEKGRQDTMEFREKYQKERSEYPCTYDKGYELILAMQDEPSVYDCPVGFYLNGGG